MSNATTSERKARIQRAYGRSIGHQKKDEDFSDLAQKYSYLVHRWARRYAGTSGGIVDWEDLVSVGLMGLVQARMNYAPDSERPFAVYAEFRVKGAILDELRRIDPMSQPMRRKVRALGRKLEELSHELGREPTEQELAKALDLSLAKVQKLRRETQSLRFTEVTSADTRELRNDMSVSGWDKAEMRAALTQAIGVLDERSQIILNLYYFEGLTMRELGDVVSLTEARVSQLHKAAIKTLRASLKGPTPK
ncbi:MAG: RNA polymerase sigma factor for flagellar operon FliA [Myxococcota bacterium]|jgi:RNA polymerase sigma factor for flagellar operon FliA